MSASAPGPGRPRRPGVRWSSVSTVLGAALVVAVCLWLVLRGRAWAWVPLVVAAAVGFREIRFLQRADHQRNAPR